MRLVVSVLVLFLAAASPSVACDKGSGAKPSGESTESMLARTVFNRVTPESLEIDVAAKKAYNCRYIFADVFGGLEQAKPTAGGLPKTPVRADGQPIIGKVVIAYIITLDGLAKDPVVIESSDPQLTAVALAAMQNWRFQPASFNGRSVASLAAQEFPFNGP